MIIDLSSYVIPKLRSVEASIEPNDFQPIMINLGSGINPDDD